MNDYSNVNIDVLLEEFYELREKVTELEIINNKLTVAALSISDERYSNGDGYYFIPDSLIVELLDLLDKSEYEQE